MCSERTNCPFLEEFSVLNFKLEANEDGPYRFFRVQMLSNKKGDGYMYCAGIEMYGSLIQAASSDSANARD